MTTVPWSTEVLFLVRTFVPESMADDATLEATYDALDDSWQATAIHHIRRYVNELAASPASFTIVGEYGQDSGANLAYWREVLKTLGGMLPGPDELPDDSTVAGGFSVGQIVRVQPR